jgi:hypothetical protein
MTFLPCSGASEKKKKKKKIKKIKTGYPNYPNYPNPISTPFRRILGRFSVVFGRSGGVW